MTDLLDLGALVYSDGFFLTRQARRPPVFRGSGADARSRYRHVFTSQGSGSTAKEMALEIVRSARRKVFIASYLLGEADLLDAIFATAQRLRGGVYVISELSERSMRQHLAELEDAPDPDAAVRAHKKNFAELTRHAVAVRGRPDCHAKFITADDRIALVSSANLDTRGLSITGENGVVITDADQVERLARFFTRLWDSCSYEMPAGSDHYSVRERAPQPSRCQVPVPEIAARAGIIWTWAGQPLILRHVIDIIGRARKNLLLATFSLNDLTANRELLLKPLEAATAGRAVQVSLLCRGRNNVPSHRRDAAALHDLGVQIHADSLNHAKAVIADDQYGALFSANLDARHGLLDGVETGVRLDSQPALDEAVRFFSHSIEHADLQYARNPTGRQMDHRLAARWRTPWSHETRIKVTTEPETWQQFRAAASTAPVLYSQEPHGSIRIHAAGRQWLLSAPSGTSARNLAPAATEPSRTGQKTPAEAADLLDHWLSSSRSGNQIGVTRGICPAVLEFSSSDGAGPN